jgi:hypothetical protein
MPDLGDLQAIVDDAWTYARQARQYSREARARATRTRHEVQHAYYRAGLAWLALSMAEATPMTRAITARILARRGLLDEQPAFRAARKGRRPRSLRPPRGMTGTPHTAEGGLYARPGAPPAA